MMIEMINYGFVLFFGIVVSLYLADINFTDHKKAYIITLISFGVAQVIFYLIMGENLLLSAAATQAQKEITQLSASQKQASIYRHDLRHHMTFLQNCIAENKLDQALTYIHQICTDIDNSRVIRYCENDALNLIFSSYADQAKDAGIDLQLSVTAADFTRFQITDLCSLFANALENAIHACEKLPSSVKRYITLKVYEKITGSVFILQIITYRIRYLKMKFPSLTRQTMASVSGA